MKVVSQLAEAGPVPGLRTALVPTMGALHEGHLGLIRAAKAETDRVVLSIFVNPTQFGPNEDFSRYPRDLEGDLEKAAAAGADLAFTPTASQMYPSKDLSIEVGGVAELFEGAIRPGHFNGVATVVCKLFNITRPEVAWFGLKDLQQCAVVRRMVEGLNMPVELRFAETTREADGLAMSSRNRYLSDEERTLAPLIYQILSSTRSSILSRSLSVNDAIIVAKSDLSKAGFNLDYLDMVDWKTMRPISDLQDTSALIVAARLGTTRLIDNILLS